MSIDREPASHYFQLVYYPQDRSDLSILYKLGMIHFSPLHSANLNGKGMMTWEQARNWRTMVSPKAHYHVLIHTNKKITYNSFYKQLCELLNEDFTGIAVKQSECLVGDVKAVLRYYLHLDIPTKEHFNLEMACSHVSPTFAIEVAKAYNVEIRYIISAAIYDNIVDSIEDIMYLWGAENWVMSAWLNYGNNLRLVQAMLYDKDRKAKKAYYEKERR